MKHHHVAIGSNKWTQKDIHNLRNTPKDKKVEDVRV